MSELYPIPPFVKSLHTTFLDYFCGDRCTTLLFWLAGGSRAAPSPSPERSRPSCENPLSHAVRRESLPPPFDNRLPARRERARCHPAHATTRTHSRTAAALRPGGKYDFPADDRVDHLHVGKPRRGDRQRIVEEDHEVREPAGLERTQPRFLMNGLGR